MVRDEQGIPQVYADTDADLMCAQGFVHAQDRFFEMDFRRHVTAGRLSRDVRHATPSRPTSSSARWAGDASPSASGRCWSPDPGRADAYAAGVNAYLDRTSPSADRGGVQRARPRRPATTRPEPWTPVDSLAWLKAMAWDLRGNIDDEIDRVLALADRSAADRSRDLYPALPLPGARRRSSTRAPWSTGSSSRTPDRGTRNPRRAGVTADRRAPLGRAAPRAATGCPTLLGHGDGIG